MEHSSFKSETDRPDVSIITTLYRSAPHILEFYQQSKASLQKIASSYEIILVNDGSPDDSLARAIEISNQDPNVKVVDLSRNFGQHHAILAGLSVTKGNLVFLIDSDLEEPPVCIEQFYQKMKEDPEVDVVYGVQAGQRKGKSFERVSGLLFYKLFNFISSTKISENICSARLMRREYVDELLSMGDANLFLGAQFAWLGFNQLAVPIEKKQVRRRSSYSLAKKISLFVNAVSSFSSQPIRLIFYIGAVLFTLSSALSFYIVVKKLLNPEVSAGWSSIMVSIWLIGSLIIMFLGTIGIYISKIFNEVKQRQRFIIRKIYGR